jgi:hypothetical protein
MLSETYEVKKHDKKLADEQKIPFSSVVQFWKDTDFQGYSPDHVTTYQPTKKQHNKRR